jgi:hypothetical protein
LAAELNPKEETSVMTATLVLLVKMESLALLVNLVILAKKVKLAILDSKDYLVPLVSENRQHSRVIALCHENQQVKTDLTVVMDMMELLEKTLTWMNTQNVNTKENLVAMDLGSLFI